MINMLRVFGIDNRPALLVANRRLRGSVFFALKITKQGKLRCDLLFGALGALRSVAIEWIDDEPAE